MRRATVRGTNEGETNSSARQSFKSQPTSRCKLRTARRPIVTSSSSEMGRDSMPVWCTNLRGMVSPNQSLPRIHGGSKAAMAEMPTRGFGKSFMTGCGRRWLCGFAARAPIALTELRADHVDEQVEGGFFNVEASAGDSGAFLFDEARGFFADDGDG